MPRTRTASIALSAPLLLLGVYVFAQDPFAAGPATPFKGFSTTPTVIQHGVPGATQGGVRTMGLHEYQGKLVDEPTQNRDRELSRDTSGLIEKYAQAKDAKDKADVEKELARVVADHFALRQDIREKELLDLEEQLKRLRKVHDQRTAEKDRIVTDRVQQLLRESTGLGWGTEAHGPRRESVGKGMNVPPEFGPRG